MVSKHANDRKGQGQGRGTDGVYAWVQNVKDDVRMDYWRAFVVIMNLLRSAFVTYNALPAMSAIPSVIRSSWLWPAESRQSGEITRKKTVVIGDYIVNARHVMTRTASCPVPHS